MLPATSPRSLVFVLGGSGALGSAIAAEQLARGNRIVVLDRLAPRLENVDFFQIDIASQDDVDRCFKTIDRAGMVPDILIVASGYLKGGSFEKLQVPDLLAHMEINTFGAFRVAQACVARMKGKGGRLLFLSSVHGHVGVSSRCAYAMSKAALEAMARAIAVEFAAEKIRVNILAPGPVDTGMQGDEAARQYWMGATPAGRVATAVEIARFAAVMTSDDASFISGQTIHIDGGVTNLRNIAPAAHPAPQVLSKSPR